MHPLTHSATHLDPMAGWALMIGFGAYHGLNPGMGWLFALALGLQQKSERAIWRSMLPITTGHAVSIVLVAALVLAAGHWLPVSRLRYLTAMVLLAFAVFKLFTYYRHPRWVGMRVGMRDLFLWSFLMAAAHGAGLMVAPTLLEVGHAAGAQTAGLSAGTGMLLAVLLHTAAMLAVMLLVALVVYRKLGLKILRSSWVNFDLIWAVALLVVGVTALYHAVAMGSA
ncbi:MAG: hypothetical protein U5J82_00745 [Desulfobacterales bacterium]|nr:hypothetical protein [Desulfobacterales bacterium]